MSGIGSRMKRERELRGISLESVAKATKINIKILKLLEADEFSSLPSPVFVKGFLKSYSKHIGLDPNDAVLMYEDYLAKDKNSNLADTPNITAQKGNLLSRKHITIGILVFLFIALLLLFALFKKERGKDITTPTDLKKNLPSKINTKTAKRKGSHTLTFKASKVTWIRVVIDGGDTKEVILRPGDTVSWKAKKGFFLVVGNAGGVEMTFDGKPSKKIGEPGQVVKFSLPR